MYDDHLEIRNQNFSNLKYIEKKVKFAHGISYFISYICIAFLCNFPFLLVALHHSCVLWHVYMLSLMTSSASIRISISVDIF
jgi:hypothetical protein